MRVHIYKYVTMYIYMHTCIHVYMYACMYVCMDGWMYGCMDVWMYVVWMHVCTYARMHVCRHAGMQACMYACMHVCMYACICMHACSYAMVCYSMLCFAMQCNVCMHTCIYTFVYIYYMSIPLLHVNTCTKIWVGRSNLHLFPPFDLLTNATRSQLRHTCAMGWVYAHLFFKGPASLDSKSGTSPAESRRGRSLRTSGTEFFDVQPWAHWCQPSNILVSSGVKSESVENDIFLMVVPT